MKTQSTEEAFDFPDFNSSEAAHDKFHNWEPNTLPNTNCVINTKQAKSRAITLFTVISAIDGSVNLQKRMTNMKNHPL